MFHVLCPFLSSSHGSWEDYLFQVIWHCVKNKEDFNHDNGAAADDDDDDDDDDEAQFVAKHTAGFRLGFGHGLQSGS